MIDRVRGWDSSESNLLHKHILDFGVVQSHFLFDEIDQMLDHGYHDELKDPKRSQWTTRDSGGGDLCPLSTHQNYGEAYENAAEQVDSESCQTVYGARASVGVDSESLKERIRFKSSAASVVMVSICFTWSGLFRTEPLQNRFIVWNQKSLRDSLLFRMTTVDSYTPFVVVVDTTGIGHKTG